MKKNQTWKQFYLWNAHTSTLPEDSGCRATIIKNKACFITLEWCNAWCNFWDLNLESQSIWTNCPYIDICIYEQSDWTDLIGHVCMLTYFALFSVQVELVLADGHDPDGFDQWVTGIPSVDHQPRLAKRALSHCSPACIHTQTHARIHAYTHARTHTRTQMQHGHWNTFREETGKHLNSRSVKIATNTLHTCFEKKIVVHLLIFR